MALMLLALVSGYVTGMTVGSSGGKVPYVPLVGILGMRDGRVAGEQQYQLLYCVHYPRALLAEQQYLACRKVGK